MFTLMLGSLTNLSGTNLAGSGKMLGRECWKVGDVAATWPCRAHSKLADAARQAN